MKLASIGDCLAGLRRFDTALKRFLVPWCVFNLPPPHVWLAEDEENVRSVVDGNVDGARATALTAVGERTLMRLVAAQSDRTIDDDMVGLLWIYVSKEPSVQVRIVFFLPTRGDAAAIRSGIFPRGERCAPTMLIQRNREGVWFHRHE